MKDEVKRKTKGRICVDIIADRLHITPALFNLVHDSSPSPK